MHSSAAAEGQRSHQDGARQGPGDKDAPGKGLHDRWQRLVFIGIDMQKVQLDS